MIETMKVSVTTPIATPRIVSAERSLFALTVATAIAADSLMSSNDISSTEYRGPSRDELLTHPPVLLFGAERGQMLEQVRQRPRPAGAEAERVGAFDPEPVARPPGGDHHGPNALALLPPPRVRSLRVYEERDVSLDAGGRPDGLDAPHLVGPPFQLVLDGRDAPALRVQTIQQLRLLCLQA